LRLFLILLLPFHFTSLYLRHITIRCAACCCLLRGAEPRHAFSSFFIRCLFFTPLTDIIFRRLMIFSLMFTLCFIFVISPYCCFSPAPRLSFSLMPSIIFAFRRYFFLSLLHDGFLSSIPLRHFATHRHY